MNEHKKTSSKERLISKLDPRLQSLGREVLDASTTEERLREITKVGRIFHQTDTEQPSEAAGNIWSDYTDDQLADMLSSSQTPGAIKDEIAEYVVNRENLSRE